VFKAKSFGFEHNSVRFCWSSLSKYRYLDSRRSKSDRLLGYITSMPDALTLNSTTFSPPLFCAPMAGITHSAFRRLLADYGGYGALFTEMLAANSLLVDNFKTSPYVKRRPAEGKLIYQLLVGITERLDAVFERLRAAHPDGIDINCACPAPDARFRKAGGTLFEDDARMAQVLHAVRRLWPGPLSVKIRLGKRRDGWQERLCVKLKLFEECGVDAVILHPRFSEDKLKRPAAHPLFAWAVGQTRLPIIASGDITGPEVVRTRPEHFKGVAGIMVGRMAALRPWIFRSWCADQEPEIADYAGVWERFRAYVCEDFPPEKALLRLKIFTAYYARNFFFGHTLAREVQAAVTLNALEERARAFLVRNPQVVSSPCLASV